jgi:hypothetical protein
MVKLGRSNGQLGFEPLPPPIDIIPPEIKTTNASRTRVPLAYLFFHIVRSFDMA